MILAIVAIKSKIFIHNDEVTQSQMAHDALNLYASNQSFYRLENLLWKRFLNTRKTFAV